MPYMPCYDRNTKLNKAEGSLSALPTSGGNIEI